MSSESKLIGNMSLTAYVQSSILHAVAWTVRFSGEFEPEFDRLAETVQDELLARAAVLERFGPMLGRPLVDTLHESSYANMKELRFDANNGVWRVAFAFDPWREAILLTAGNKSGVAVRRFYRQLIGVADRRFKAHLERLERNRR